MVWIIVVVLSAITMFLYMWFEAHRNVVKKQDIYLDRFPESFNGLKVFFISDIHTRQIDNRLLDQVDEEVDLVIIGGDLIEKGVPFDRVSENLNQLSKLAPIYFVWGNNDYEVDFRKLDVLLREKGVSILDNTCARFDTEEDRLYLLGVDDPTMDRDRLDLALQDVDEDGYKILVSHNPAIIHKIKKEDDIGFVLSGHTHGGQIRFFKWGIAARGGLFDKGVTKLFISNGYGYTALPLRLCAPSEAHIFSFHRKN
ncbi:metallophosphoesterase [Pseudalkalibacillus sp. SCS-8]|uniref:metallophosphoesterase n=1 Tax=Pseudalkalibacillus nanhaiensis TaxID=3115291 RepID=UPI0032DAD0E9